MMKNHISEKKEIKLPIVRQSKIKYNSEILSRSNLLPRENSKINKSINKESEKEKVLFRSNSKSRLDYSQIQYKINREINVRNKILFTDVNSSKYEDYSYSSNLNIVPNEKKNSLILNKSTNNINNDSFFSIRKHHTEKTALNSRLNYNNNKNTQTLQRNVDERGKYFYSYNPILNYYASNEDNNKKLSDDLSKLSNMSNLKNIYNVNNLNNVNNFGNIYNNICVNKHTKPVNPSKFKLIKNNIKIVTGSKDQEKDLSFFKKLDFSELPLSSGYKVKRKYSDYKYNNKFCLTEENNNDDLKPNTLNSNNYSSCNNSSFLQIDRNKIRLSFNETNVENKNQVEIKFKDLNIENKTEKNKKSNLIRKKFLEMKEKVLLKFKKEKNSSNNSISTSNIFNIWDKKDENLIFISTNKEQLDYITEIHVKIYSKLLEKSFHKIFKISEIFFNKNLIKVKKSEIMKNPSYFKHLFEITDNNIHLIKHNFNNEIKINSELTTKNCQSHKLSSDSESSEEKLKALESKSFKDEDIYDDISFNTINTESICESDSSLSSTEML